MATIAAGGKGQGERLDQFDGPIGICFDDHNRAIYVADMKNHRIVEWKSNEQSGRVVVGGNGRGNRLDQLNIPTDVVIDRQNNAFIIADQGNRRVVGWPRQSGCSSGKIIISDIDCARLAIHQDGFLYVSDWKKNEVRRWKIGETRGIIVAGGNGEGDQLNQLHFPTHLCVNPAHTLYISDHKNHRVMKWMKDAKEGIVVAGSDGQGDRATQLSFPHGVIVDQFGRIYVVDCWNHRVMRWWEGTKDGTIVVGGNGEGDEANQLSYPISLSMDGEGNLYVADYKNNRIQKFDRDSN